ncbi:MAG: glycosyltransferase [Clostridia bacterium]|nr:glycosyltransferase [Clostridia bacterium]
MHNMPLVSIVIPVYNGANYVKEAIDAALAQTYTNIEVVVVNDGSVDDGATEKVCLAYGDKIQYYKKENGGCASAINYGISMAKGEYISWLSHDDLYDPNKLETQISFYETYGLDRENTIISNTGRLIDENGNTFYHPGVKGQKRLFSKDMFRYLLFKKCFNGCGLLIPKNLFEKADYFREDMRFVLDWNLWLKFAIADASVFIDDAVLVSNRRHSGQVTVKQKQLHQTEAIMTCEELFEQLAKLEKWDFLLELYYFCYATNKAVTPQILNCLKEHHVPINGFCKIKHRGKMVLRRMLKKVYHAVKR